MSKYNFENHTVKMVKIAFKLILNLFAINKDRTLIVKKLEKQ